MSRGLGAFLSGAAGGFGMMRDNPANEGKPGLLTQLGILPAAKAEPQGNMAGPRERGIMERLGLQAGPAEAGMMAGKMQPGAAGGGQQVQMGQTGQRGEVASPSAPAVMSAPAAPAAPRGTGRKAAMAFAPEVDAAITSAVTKYGVDADYMRRMAEIESSGNPLAKNDSGATGLYQFMGETAKQYGLTDRTDPVASADAAARLTQANANQLKKALGRDPTPGELYLAHQQGGDGASALLSNPDMNVVDALALAYEGKRGKAKAAVRQNGGKTTMTAGEFANKWMTKFEPQDYQSVRTALNRAKG